jgi:hypothetical protein
MAKTRLFSPSPDLSHQGRGINLLVATKVQ